MLPPNLVKLISEGKAFFRTFVAGGGTKSVLPVPNDRYIVIIGYTFYPFVGRDSSVPTDFDQWRNVQMMVASTKSMNHFIMRNNTGTDLSIIGGLFVNIPTIGEPHVQDNLYLTHDADVSITFSRGDALTPITVAISPPKSPAKPPPIQMGREGQTGITATGNEPVIRKMRPTSVIVGTEIRTLGDFDDPTPGVPASFKELQFPVEPSLVFSPTDLADANNYPIVNFRYVEVLGNPVDLSSSN